jgi:hypothetical protein
MKGCLMTKKVTSPSVASLAGKVLAGQKPTPAQIKTLAASALSQDEPKRKMK